MEDIVTRLRRAVDNEPFMLGGEHDLLKDALREITTLLGCCDGAAAQDAHIRREREEHRAEIEKLRAENERLFNEDTKTRHALKGWVFVCPDGGDEPTHERVAAVVAEVERLREALVLGSEVLASHQGSPQREWHSGGAWLYPGDSINVVRAPLPEIKVEP